MTWRLYAIASGGAFIATYFVSVAPPLDPRQAAVTAQTQAADRAAAVVDLTAQADRLHARIAEATEYREPSRNAFRFGPRVDRAAARTAIDASDVPAPVPPATAPGRPPFALVGMASTVEDGVTQRTAILSSLRGVQLVKVGEAIDGTYRVVSIDDDAVTVESTGDGSHISIRLSDADSRSITP